MPALSVLSGTQFKTSFKNVPLLRYNSRPCRLPGCSRKARCSDRSESDIGRPTEEAHAKVRKWNDIQEDFLEQTGLKRQYYREWVPNPKNSIESKPQNGTIKSIGIDDFKTATYGKDIDPEAEEVIYKTLKDSEKKDNFYISETVVKSIPENANGKPALQIEPLPYGLLQLNINKDVFSGKTLAEVDRMFATSQSSLANSLEEAVKRACQIDKRFECRAN